MKICNLCKALVFDSEWIDHFRKGNKKHRLAYLSVIREINETYY